MKNRRNCQRSKNRRENKLESRKEQTDKKINRKERKTYTTETEQKGEQAKIILDQNIEEKNTHSTHYFLNSRIKKGRKRKN